MNIKRRTLIRAAATSAAMLSLRPLVANSPWHQAAPMPIKAQEIYPVVHRGRLIVAGGIAAKLGVPYFTASSYSFDPATHTWSDLPGLPENLHHVALVSDGTKIYAIGGFNGGYSHIWRMRDNVYSLATDSQGEPEAEWELASTLPTPQAEGVATVHEGVIHVVTGQQPKGSANSDRQDHQEGELHWRYEDGKWETAAPIPTPRNSATGGWVDDQLIVTGGRTSAGNLAVTEVYDAKEDRWREAAPMPLPQAGTASVVHNGALIVFGGEVFHPEAMVFENVWRYQLAEDRWTPMPALPTPRHGLGAGLIGDKAYVIGGATEPSGRGTSDLNEVLTLGF